jgi:hypothetical protein
MLSLHLYIQHLIVSRSRALSLITNMNKLVRSAILNFKKLNSYTNLSRMVSAKEQLVDKCFLINP